MLQSHTNEYLPPKNLIAFFCVFTASGLKKSSTFSTFENQKKTMGLSPAIKTISFLVFPTSLFHKNPKTKHVKNIHKRQKQSSKRKKMVSCSKLFEVYLVLKAHPKLDLSSLFCHKFLTRETKGKIDFLSFLFLKKMPIFPIMRSTLFPRNLFFWKINNLSCIIM